MKYNLKPLSLLTLAVFLLTTALFPLAQASAAEDIQVDPNNAEEITVTPLLYGIWAAEVGDEYTDVHLWYETNPELIQATSTFAYDHSGSRVLMNNGQTTRVYANKYFNTDSETHTKHIFAGDLLIATITGSGPTSTIQYIHTDHLTGSSSATDDTGGVVQLLDYYPYGELRIDDSYSTFDEQRKFTGHEYDRDTGLNYMGARYYNPAVGRFVSQDPAFWNLVAGIADPHLMNSYAYARSNPLAYNDPDGQWPTLAQTNSFLARVDRYNPLHPLFSPGADNLYYGYKNRDYGQVARGGGDITINGALIIGGALDIGFAAGAAYNVYQRYAAANNAISDLQKISGKTNWGNPATLERHFKDHAEEFGAKSPGEYAQKANTWISSAKNNSNIDRYTDRFGYTTYFDSKTSTTASTNSSSGTATYFRAQDNYNGNGLTAKQYFEQKKELYGVQGGNQ